MTATANGHGDPSPNTASNAPQASSNGQYSAPDAVEVAFLAAGGFGRAQKQVIFVMGLVYVACAASVELPVFIATEAERTIVSCPSTASVEIVKRPTAPAKGHISNVTKGDSSKAEDTSSDSECPVGRTVTDDKAFCEDGYTWEYATPDRTTSAEFELVCERHMLRSSIGSLLFFGILCGNLVFTPIPDRIGRCKAMLAATSLASVSTALCAFANTFSLYLFGRFLLGFAQAGAGVVAYILASEVVDASHTSMVMLTMMIMWAVGVMAVVCVAFVVPHWRILSWIHFSLFFFLTLLSILAWQRGWESPRWLASRGDMAGFNRVMGSIAAGNGRGDDFQAHLRSQKSEQAKKKSEGEPDGMSVGDSMKSVLCERPLSFYSLLFILAFCCCSLGYYGLSLSIENLGWDLYLAAAVNALVEIPACLGAQRLADLPLAGRRGAICSSMLLSGCCCIISAWLPNGNGLGIFIAMIGKMGVTCSYNVVFLHVSEVFPACVSGIAYGVFQTFSRVTGVAAPIVAALPAPLPRLVAGGTAIVVALPLLGLPETRGKPIPTTLEDVRARAAENDGNNGGSQAKQSGSAPTRRYGHFLEEDNADSIGGDKSSKAGVHRHVVGHPTENSDWV